MAHTPRISMVFMYLLILFRVWFNFIRCRDYRLRNVSIVAIKVKTVHAEK